MKRRGLFRLWVVLSAIFVPGLAFWAVNENAKFWRGVNVGIMRLCDNRSLSDFNKCVHEAGADQTMFQHEHTTPARYWGEALGLSFGADLILTAAVIGLFLVARWVVRGFKAEPSER